MGIGGSSSKPRGRGRCCGITAQTPNRDGATMTTTTTKKTKNARCILLVVSIPCVVCSWRSVESWFVTIVARCCCYRCSSGCCCYCSCFFFFLISSINSINTIPSFDRTSNCGGSFFLNSFFCSWIIIYTGGGGRDGGLGTMVFGCFLVLVVAYIAVRHPHVLYNTIIELCTIPSCALTFIYNMLSTLQDNL